MTIARIARIVVIVKEMRHPEPRIMSRTSLDGLGKRERARRGRGRGAKMRLERAEQRLLV